MAVRVTKRIEYLGKGATVVCRDSRDKWQPCPLLPKGSVSYGGQLTPKPRNKIRNTSTPQPTGQIRNLATPRSRPNLQRRSQNDWESQPRTTTGRFANRPVANPLVDPRGFDDFPRVK